MISDALSGSGSHPVLSTRSTNKFFKLLCVAAAPQARSGGDVFLQTVYMQTPQDCLTYLPTSKSDHFEASTLLFRPFLTQKSRNGKNVQIKIDVKTYQIFSWPWIFCHENDIFHHHHCALFHGGMFLICQQSFSFHRQSAENDICSKDRSNEDGSKVMRRRANKMRHAVVCVYIL